MKIHSIINHLYTLTPLLSVSSTSTRTKTGSSQNSNIPQNIRGEKAIEQKPWSRENAKRLLQAVPLAILSLRHETKESEAGNNVSCV